MGCGTTELGQGVELEQSFHEAGRQLARIVAVWPGRSLAERRPGLARIPDDHRYDADWSRFGWSGGIDQ